MEQTINYQAEVKKIYPDAVKEIHGVLYYISLGENGDAIGFSVTDFELAWQSAYQTLLNQEKL
jgi:hypothetical protein